MSRIVEPLTEPERAQFIAACRTFMTHGPGRVKYRHRGRDYRGVDCIGIAIFALQSVGRVVQDRKAYSARSDGYTLRAILQDHLGDPVPKDTMQPGDIPLMRWFELDGVRFDCHVGVVVPHPLAGQLSLLHAYHVNGEAVEHIIDRKWRHRIVEVYRP